MLVKAWMWKTLQTWGPVAFGCLIASAIPPYTAAAKVLLPILVIMIFFTMLREYVGRLMHSNAKPDLKLFKETQMLQRASIIRANCHWIPESGFFRRRAYFTDKERGVLNDTSVVKAEKDPLAAMTDPNIMMMQQKQMITGMLPQMVMMGLISYFFSGFVMAKIPLPLSLRFKHMTQRGIELGNTLDVAFVSSFSWYVLVSVGIGGVMSLILGRQTMVNDAALMQQQMAMQTGQMPGGPDTAKLFQAEQEALNMIDHKWVVEKAERRLLAMCGFDVPPH